MNNSKLIAKVKLHSENARMPTRRSKDAAGYDLYSAGNYTVKAQNRNVINTDISITIPNGCYGRIAPRSGLAVNNFIDIGAGVIDPDYRGSIQVVVFNFESTPFEIAIGDRIAQLIFEKIEFPELQEVQSLNETDRGSSGFGSTGGFNHQVTSYELKEKS